MDILITLPAKIKFSEYQKELNESEKGGVLNFKVSFLPKNSKIGDKCYLIHRGYIIGYMYISGFSNKSFICSVTAKKWTGNFIERSGKFYKIPVPVKHKGFQGWRYFNFRDYFKSLLLKET